MKKGIEITKGMANAMGKLASGRQCSNPDCEFVVPKYKGRYPEKCLSCGAELMKESQIDNLRAKALINESLGISY